MRTINCLIADDEEIARDIIKSYVEQIKTLHLVAICSNGAEVFNMLKDNPIDLIFLDIQMPVLTGIELIRSLKDPPAIILTTAFREFAVEGYEFNVVDYLLKPISFERFLKAINKFESTKKITVHEIATITNPAIPELDFIYVKSDKKMVRLLLKNILYIEGLKDYVKIYLSHKTIITYRTLTYFEEKLSANHFLRVHRSYIISLNHITSYSATHIEMDKAVIPIGSSYGKDVIKKLGFSD